MNCQRFEIVAGDLARGQMMGVDIRSEALTHSSECTHCATLLRHEEMLTRDLRSLATEMDSVNAPADVESRLLSVFRQPHIVVPMPVARSTRHYWLVAVAALFLIVFGIFALRWRQNGIEAPKQIAVTQGQQKEQTRPAVEPSPIVPTVDKKTQELASVPKRRITPRQLQAKATRPDTKDNEILANHVSNEVATEFMPLGYLSSVSLQDGGQIVRVEVPRATLASFGLPVNMDRYNERVKADILLGIDGTARAIRFVQDKR